MAISESAFAQRWRERRRELPDLFYMLTEEDIDRINGQVEPFLQTIQGRYRVTRDQAEGMAKQALGRIDEADDPPVSNTGEAQ